MNSNPVRRAMVILLVSLAVLAFGLSIAQDQHTIKLQSRTAMEDPHALATLAVLVGAGVTTGNTFTVLKNGDQAFAAMLDVIEHARERISFETFVYESGKIGDRFTDAFERAARRGVLVQMVVDAVGASAVEEEDIDRLRAAGVIVQRFNPTRWYTLEESNYRTHRKLLIVDGAVGFTGGIGIADHWLPERVEPDAKAGTFWRDTHIRLTGPVVERLEAAFYENFAETADVTTPYLLHASDVQAPPAGSHEGEAFVVRSASSGGSSDLKRLYLMALAMARRTVDIASPYFITDESVMWALESAVARGVVIRVLVEGDMTDALPVKYASRHAYDQLLSKGIAIHEYQPTMMHAKVFVVDGVWSMFGSANFDNRSLELNDELNVAVESPALAAQLLDDFEHDLTRATRLELSRWRQRPMRDKFREYVWSYFGEVF